MLKLLRKKKVTKRIFYVLSAIIIPAFVIWGSANVMQKNKTPDYAGMIFGKKVSFDDFYEAMSAWKTQLKLQYGDKTNEVIETFFDPIDATWDRLILLYEAKKQKIKVDNQEIINTITSFPFLQENGRFNPQAYELFLRYALDMPPRVFEEQLRENIAMSKIFKKTTADISLTDSETEEAYKNENEQTRVRYVDFATKNYKDGITLNEQEISDFYEQSKEEFRMPPQINAEYLGITFEQETSQTAKDAAKEKMERAGKMAKSKPFKEIAAELNITYQETGLFGLSDPIPTLGWMPQINPLLFDLSTDQTSQIIQVESGIYFFKVVGKKDTYLPELKEIKEKVIDVLKNKKAKEIARQKAQEFIVSLLSDPTKKISSSDFEKIAQNHKLQVKETPLFSRQAYIPELGMAQSLKTMAFRLKNDEVAKEPIELEQGFYCIQSIETIGVDEEKYKKEKEAFTEQLLSQKKNKAFGDYFSQLKKQAHLVNYLSRDFFTKGRR